MGEWEPIPEAVATAAQYRDALLAIRDQLTSNMLTMLEFQYRAPNRTVTATTLARAMGYPTYQPANRQYGELGKLIADFLNYSPPRRPDGTHRYWTTLSTDNPDLDEEGDWEYVMRPELAAALADLRWV